MTSPMTLTVMTYQTRHHVLIVIVMPMTRRGRPLTIISPVVTPPRHLLIVSITTAGEFLITIFTVTIRLAPSRLLILKTK